MESSVKICHIRISLQVSRSKIIGLAKILKELLEFKENSDDEGGKLYEELQQMATSSSFPIREEMLIENIKKYRAVKKEYFDTLSNRTLTFILRGEYAGDNKPSI